MPQDGLLLVDKPRGLTSHDVIAHLRRSLKTKRLGHTGTLDPMATGLLPVLVGKATRLAQYLSGSDKSYLAVLKLGAATDTLDATGTIIAERAVNIKEEDLRQVILSFKGQLWQKPPMYSAKKVAGKKLYELARAGREVERKSCDITIHRIEIIDISLPDVTILVHCSAGTYIRVLASDIGEKAGTLAHLTALTRTQIGHFSLEMSSKLADLEAMGNEAYTKCLSMASALYSLPKMEITAEQYRRVSHGGFLSKADVQALFLEKPITLAPQLALLYQGELVAIYDFWASTQEFESAPSFEPLLKPKAVFVDENGN